MKHLKQFGLALLGLIVLTVFSSFHAKAQSKPKADTVITAVAPVFNGTEKNLVDSLESVSVALQDSVLKDKVNNAITVIQKVPSGGGADKWFAYIVAVLGALFGVYHYIKSRLTPKPK